MISLNYSLTQKKNLFFPAWAGRFQCRLPRIFLSCLAWSLGLITRRGQCVSDHVVRAKKCFQTARSPRRRHRSELTGKA